MDYKNFEKFQMSGPMYIYVSKKTRKIHAIELSSGKIQLVKNMGANAYVIVKGLLLTAMQFNSSEFYSLMNFVDRYEDPYVYQALLAFRECTHNAKFDAATKIYID